jgi:hypothetical protein
MGEPLLFQTNWPALLQAAQDVFGRFPPAESNAPPLCLQLFVREVAASPHDTRVADSRVYPKPVYQTAGHLFYLTVGAENTITVDLERGYACGFITPRLAQDRRFVQHTFIEAAALAMLGLAREFVAVHAACVVKQGRSILIQAPAGVGKTTLALACVKRGFQLLAEDVVQVKLAPAGPQLWGVPWKLHLLADSLRFFPELGHRPSAQQVNGEWKVPVDLETHFPGSTITQARPDLVVFLERATGRVPTGYTPITLAEAAARFEVVWSWVQGWQERYDVALRQLLAQGSYRLIMNGTPWEAVDALEALLKASPPRGEDNDQTMLRPPVPAVNGMTPAGEH